MESLRLTLFLGLVFHKLLWEVMKRKDRAQRTRQRSPISRGRWLVKSLKGLILFFLIIQTLFLDLFPITDQPAFLRMIGTAIYFAGLGTAVIGRLQLGKNWIDLEDYRILPGQSIVTNGIYRYIRHPIYTGDLLLLLGLELALNSWIVVVVVVPILVVIRQTLAEEVLLSQSLPDYSAYCKRTKRFIPFLI
jgi:protein-S-isoprenylcysteine O-methyltransferase Ste14